MWGDKVACPKTKRSGAVRKQTKEPGSDHDIKDAVVL